MANRKKRQPADALTTPIVELIVRRGALRRFDELKRNTTTLPVRLSWDRRLTERRTSSTKAERDARRTERRQSPPFTWEVADFVAVDVPSQDGD